MKIQALENCLWVIQVGGFQNCSWSSELSFVWGDLDGFKITKEQQSFVALNRGLTIHLDPRASSEREKKIFHYLRNFWKAGSSKNNCKTAENKMELFNEEPSALGTYHPVIAFFNDFPKNSINCLAKATAINRLFVVSPDEKTSSKTTS